MRSNESYADPSWVNYYRMRENDSVYGLAWPYVVHRMYSINRRTPADARPVLIHSGGANICLQLDSLS